MSAFDPKRTCTLQNCCYAKWPLNPISLVATALLVGTQRDRTNLNHSIIHAALTAMTNKTTDAAA
jgi:hypothetical protein